MKHFLLLTMMLSAVSCWHQPLSPEEQAKAVLKDALEALQEKDVDAYIRYVYSEGSDTVPVQILRHLLMQHQERREEMKGIPTHLQMLEAELEGDSICTVFYQFTFADSTTELLSQKMVKMTDGCWKIQLRN